MRNFNVFVDELRDNSQPKAAPVYKIALAPSSRNGGALATRDYVSREEFIGDLRQRLRYTESAVERFFSDSERHNTLLNHALTDEDAVYFGWLPDFDRLS